LKNGIHLFIQKASYLFLSFSLFHDKKYNKVIK